MVRPEVGLMSRAGWIIALILSAGWVQASDYIGPNDGRWRDPRSWSPAGVPGAGVAANINLAPDTPFGVGMDFTYTSATALSSLSMNSSTSSMLTLNIFADLF